MLLKTLNTKKIMSKTFGELRIETENFTRPCKSYLKRRKQGDLWKIGVEMRLGDEMLAERLHI